jgi:predicted nucleic acid-binding protein
LNAYFESSALVKLVIHEEGTETAELLWDSSDGAVTSRLSYAEVRAALAAAFRAGRLTVLALADAKKALTLLVAEMQIVEVTQSVVRDAGDLAEEHGLRGYDALHLSSVSSLGQTLLVTWDLALARAGRRMGLLVAGPPVA